MCRCLIAFDDMASSVAVQARCLHSLSRQDTSTTKRQHTILKPPVRAPARSSVSYPQAFTGQQFEAGRREPLPLYVDLGRPGPFDSDPNDIRSGRERPKAL